MAVSSAGIERNRRANKKLSGLVRGELAGFFRSLNLNKPEAARDALLAFTPVLVEKYGAVSEQIALEWYEQMRIDAGVAKGIRLTTPATPELTVASEKSVRYAAGHLFTPNPSLALGVLSTAVDKHVRNSGRETVMWNATRERATYGRVPRGKKPCSFCLVLASRDAVYGSRRSAGDKQSGNEFHGDCNCEVVAFFGDEPYPSEMLPRDYEQVYMDSRENAANDPEVREFLATLDPNDKHKDIKGIMFSMRRDFPEFVRDSAIRH